VGRCGGEQYTASLVQVHRLAVQRKADGRLKMQKQIVGISRRARDGKVGRLIAAVLGSDDTVFKHWITSRIYFSKYKTKCQFIKQKSIDFFG
jgi:hypothetical protein